MQTHWQRLLSGLGLNRSRYICTSCGSLLSRLTVRQCEQCSRSFCVECLTAEFDGITDFLGPIRTNDSHKCPVLRRLSPQLRIFYGPRSFQEFSARAS